MSLGHDLHQATADRMAGLRGKHLIRSASLSGYVELARSMGRDANALLRGVGLSTRLLDNPETPIPVAAVRELLETTARITGAEDFALRLAGARRFSNLGPISLVLKQEPSPRQALDTLGRYLKLLNQALITHVEEAGTQVVIRQELVPMPGVPQRQSMELAVAVMSRILRELIGPQWRPLHISFTHRAPLDMAAHRAFFGRAPCFDQDFNGLICALSDLQLTRTPDDPVAARFARDHLDAALLQYSQSARASCRELIIALLPGGRCTVEQVASHFSIDRRTLHRYLSAEGETFSGLLDEVRTELTLRHLRESNLPLGEVAGLLGFSGPSSFSHWFRAMFGTSVSGWRRGQGGAMDGATHSPPKLLSRLRAGHGHHITERGPSRPWDGLHSAGGELVLRSASP